MKTRRWNGTWKAMALFLLSAVMTGPVYGAASTAADAAQNRDMAALRSLLSQRADVNAAQPDGTTALHWAVYWNDVDAVNLLLRAGARVTATNRYGASPLSEAVTS